MHGGLFPSRPQMAAPGPGHPPSLLTPRGEELTLSDLPGKVPDLDRIGSIESYAPL